MRLVLFLSMFFFMAVAHAHSYYFAFAEVNFNNQTQRLEVSVESATHDLIDALQDEGFAIDQLDKVMLDSAKKRELTTFVNRFLSFKTPSNSSIQLDLKGVEVLNNGLCYIYLESSPFQIESSITIQFNWLMNSFPEQQNKITFTNNHEKFTSVFLPHRISETLQLSKK